MKLTIKPMTILVSLIMAMSCAAPATALQFCRSDIAISTPTSRFVDNANGTVTDSATGLVWKRCSEGQAWDGTTCTGDYSTFTWQQALTAGSTAVFAGASDWRLPNKNELASLIESQCEWPSINAFIFPKAPSLNFWTSTPTYNGNVWRVDFSGGFVVGNGNKSDSFAVRLVRGGE